MKSNAKDKGNRRPFTIGGVEDEIVKIPYSLSLFLAPFAK